MTYKTARVKVLSNFVNWKEAEEYDVDENTTTRELITSVLHRHGMTSRDPNLFYLTLEGRTVGAEDSPGWSMNLTDEALVMTARDTKSDGHFAMHMRQGGLLKIYDESIMPGSYYKSLFISKRTSSREVISLLLASYGKNESADNFQLVEQTSKGKELRQLSLADLPLVIDQSSHNSSLHLKRVKSGREKKSALTRSNTISSAQDLQSRSGISREATVVRLRESFRRLQRLRADQELDSDILISTPRVSTKLALSEESLDTTGSPRKSGFNNTLGKISKKLSSLTNIRYGAEKTRNSPPRSGLVDDSLRNSARSSNLQTQHSAADLLARVGLPGGSPRSSKRYSFPPASSDLSSSPQRSPRSPRKTAGGPTELPSADPVTAAIQHAFSSPRQPHRHRSFNTHAHFSRQPASAREPARQPALPASGSVSARLPVRSAADNGAVSASARRQLPQPPPGGMSEAEARRRLLALEAQRRLRMMAVSGAAKEASRTTSMRHYPGARTLATSPSKMQAKTKTKAPHEELRLTLRGIVDDSPSPPPLTTRRSSTPRPISTATQTNEQDLTSAASARSVTSHPALYDVVEQCHVFTARLTRRSMWQRFGLACFEAIFTPGSGRDEDSAHHCPAGRRPVLGRSVGAFQTVNASALASIRSLIAVDKLEGEAGGLEEGDFLLEVNGISVLSSTPQQVESLINSFLTVEITGARGRSPRAPTSTSSSDGVQEETNNQDLERQLATLRNKYAQLKEETRKNESLIAELRDAMAKKVRVRIGGRETSGRSDANSFRAIRAGYSEEVVSTV